MPQIASQMVQAVEAAAKNVDKNKANGSNDFMDLIKETVQTTQNTGYETENSAINQVMNAQGGDIGQLATDAKQLELLINTVVPLRDALVNTLKKLTEMPI